MAKVVSFVDWMMRFSDTADDRGELARELIRLGNDHPEVRKIDSFSDLICIINRYAVSTKAFQAVTDSLWGEYCAACNHEL